MPMKFDFSGYATKNDIKCADGRTIRKDAFKDCDGMTVPLVWGHKHDGPGSVLGHAVLENADDGVIAYGVFNDTDAGKNAKELVRHGDVKALSIYANQLVQKGGDVLHGMIREVSLCLAGANPGAKIEELSFEHDIDEDSDDFEALIFNGYNIMHSESDSEKENEGEDMDNETIQDVYENMSEKEKNVVDYLVGKALEHSAIEEEHSENDYIQHADEDETIQDVYNTLNEKQKNVVNYMIGMALSKADEADDEEENEMAHNLFENDGMNNSMAHAMFMDAYDAVVADAKKYGSLNASYEHHMQEGGALAHAIDTTGMDVPTMTNAQYATSVGYGINGVDFLFPDARMLNNEVEFIKRDQDWVDEVLGGVHKSPFSRVKSIYANITEDEARAKGYLRKGTPKKNEFFSLMKRTVEPTTVYKKQKIDRDDVLDAADFDLVRMLRSEMRLMLNEELARAILIGDGRLNSSDEKIDESKIKPIVSDAPLFTIQKMVTAGSTTNETHKNLIRTAILARKDYKGSGNPTFFTTEETLANLLLIEDGIGHDLYRTEAELAAKMRVKKIVTSPVMEGIKDASGNDILGIIVNLNDYNVGTDKGGEVNMFDDFNIDYNQQVYLIETRCSGMLTKPYSAIVLKMASTSNTSTDTDDDGDDGDDTNP